MKDELLVSEKEVQRAADAAFIPARLCIEPQSRYFSAAGSVIGVRLDGRDVQEVIEYEVQNEDGRGWVRVGHRMTNGRLQRSAIKGEFYASNVLRGKVEPYFRTPASRQVRRQLARLGK